jgi:RNA polymerase sigma-70 factor (ECF subfamily)
VIVSLDTREDRPCPRRRDPESRDWWERLHATGSTRSGAIADLHALLRVEAAFHIRRRVSGRGGFPRSDIDDLAVQAADDAVLVLLRKLDQYRGESHFLTWARRFAALEAPVSIRRRVGHDHVGISRDPDCALRVADSGRSVHERVEARELLDGVTVAIAEDLSARQRTILTAVVINGVAPAVLARDLQTTPGAIYKALHDARAKLRLHLP